MTSRSKIEGRIGSPEGSQRTTVEVPASVRESSPNNRLQADRGPRAVLAEAERSRLGRGG